MEKQTVIGDATRRCDMDFHDILKIIGGVGTLLLFIPLIIETLRNSAGQSFATWLLWAALDSILTISTFLKHGNFLLPMGFAIGGVIMTVLLVVKGRFAWKRLDSLILCLVIGCLIGWKLGGVKTAIVAATLATCLASVPGLIEMWRDPQRKLANIWGLYALANVVSFFGGTAMTIEERFTPAVFSLLSLLMCLAGWRYVFFQRPAN